MHWLKRCFAPQGRSFIIFVSLLLLLAAGAQWYRGSLKKRLLAQMAASVREVVTDKAEIAKIKMERSSLEFELPNLRAEHPILTNAALIADWSPAAVQAQLDPAVCAAWRAYLNRVAPLLQDKDPNLGPFLVLQEGYVAAVESLAREAFLRDKPDRLVELRTKKFAALFNDSTYVADAARCEVLAQSLVDESTLALRKAYEEALAASVTSVDPNLAAYARARLVVALKTDELRGRIQQLSEQLGEAEASAAPAVAQPQPSFVIRSPRDLLHMGSFDTYVPREKDFLGILITTAVLGFLVTLPVELRDRRWQKIGATVVLVYLGLLALRIPVSQVAANRGINVFAFFGFLVPAAFMAAIWASTFTSVFSNLVLQFIDPSGPDETEDDRLRPAYDAARQGEYRLALHFLKPKLVTDPCHYEALVLKAKLQRQLNRKWRARRTLAKVLRNRNLSTSQREHALYLRRNLKSKTDACWNLVKPEAPRQVFVQPFDF